MAMSVAINVGQIDSSSQDFENLRVPLTQQIGPKPRVRRHPEKLLPTGKKAAFRIDQPGDLRRRKKRTVLVNHQMHTHAKPLQIGGKRHGGLKCWTRCNNGCAGDNTAIKTLRHSKVDCFASSKVVSIDDEETLAEVTALRVRAR